MEQILNVHIETLPEGMYLATSDEISGLVALGRPVTETLEIARCIEQPGPGMALEVTISEQALQSMVLGACETYASGKDGKRKPVETYAHL